MTSEFRVTGATCGHCKATIERVVKNVPGVTAAELDLGSGNLKVAHEPGLETASVASAISEAGYTPEVLG